MEKLNVSVENMISSKGYVLPNQFIIHVDNKIYFQSYKTIICYVDKATRTLTIDSGAYHYSKTTSKYLNMFLDDYFSGVDVKACLNKNKEYADFIITIHK